MSSNPCISQQPSPSVKRRTFGLWPTVNEFKGLSEINRNLGGRDPTPLRSMFCTMLWTFPPLFGRDEDSSMGCDEDPSIGSVSESGFTTFDDSLPLWPAFRRRVARPSLAMRALDRSSAPRLRESSESSAAVELGDISSASSLVRSIGLSGGSRLTRERGSGFPGRGVSRVLRRLRSCVKTAWRLLGFPVISKELLPVLPPILLPKRLLSNGV